MRRYHLLALLLTFSASLYAADVPARRATPRAQAEIISPLTIEARKALFEDSHLDHARHLAQEDLRSNPGDIEALFIEMEAAALEADTAAELNAAMKLCELRPSKQEDARITIAASRVLELAANTEEFRAVIPRLQSRLALAGYRDERNAFLASLRSALVAASADGAPLINAEKEVREAGLMTEWRVAGPFGNYPNLEFDQHWQPEHDSLLQPASEGRPVEHLHFDDGQFRLPSYFPKSGVLYAASEISLKSSDQFLVRVESGGTLEVLVDGAVALRNDDRFRLTPKSAWRELKLKSGTHHVVVKFLASAAPFRLAIIPAAPQPSQKRTIEYAPEAAYVGAAQKYWAGDYSGLISDFGVAPPRTAIISFLLYKAWTHVADDSPEAATLLNSALQLAPDAIAAEYELALRAFQTERTDEALSRLQRVISVRDNFLPGQELLAQIAIHMNWPVLAEKALEFQLRVHPSCDVLLQGYKFFAGHARYERSRDLLRRIADCAPDTMAYEHTLGELGEHAMAASAAEEKVHRRPLDRSARELLVRELAMAGQMEKARSAARDLAALAPNSDRYRRMANLAKLDPAALLNDVTLHGNSGEPFYAKYRRDGVQMVRKTEDRKFSGGPALMLVNDRVARLWKDERVSLYVHKLTRMLDRDGIEKYGEVSFPRGAEILELRTIKADGSVAEPEMTPQKASVSMPSLTVGDTIEEEYVVHFGDAGGLESHPDAFRHVFGSFAAPILYSRFVAITPATDAVLYADVAPGIVPARIEADAQSRTRVWEKNDIPQSVDETAIARGDVLPSVRLQPATDWSDIRDRFRDQLIDAVRIGPRVAQIAAQLHVKNKDEEAKAREVFRTIARTVRPTGAFNPADLGSAEDTLASRSGNRTIALLAVARAAGLDADLVLARRAGDVVRIQRPSRDFYSRPLVRFHFADGQETFVDAETDGLAFGSIAPSVEHRDALLISAPHEDAIAQWAEGAAIVSLPSASDEQSVAEANITIDGRGDLKADVTIRMGSWRAAQMRSILAGIEPARRSNYYQQLATRIFAGAESVTGSTRNENNPDQKLELTLHCRVPRFLNLEQGASDIDQLVPALGLKKMYPGSVRRYPLYIDTPLIERANFRLRLPAGVKLSRTTASVNLTGAFGSYSFALRQASPELLEIQRVFSIPAQVVQPDQYADFSSFASRIDEAERVRISLQKN